MSSIVITAAKRTPVGSFLGAFANTPAHELGRIAILAALDQAGVSPDEVDEVIFGQVLTAGQGQNPTRQAAVNSSTRSRVRSIAELTPPITARMRLRRAILASCS